jgi:hypothetical protein
MKRVDKITEIKLSVIVNGNEHIITQRVSQTERGLWSVRNIVKNKIAQLAKELDAYLYKLEEK